MRRLPILRDSIDLLLFFILTLLAGINLSMYLILIQPKFIFG